MLPKTNYKNQSGQALIIILLAMSMVLTLVLSSVSRSVTDIRITTEEEESLRAFSAAEAGIEKALLELTSTGSFGSDSGTLPGQTVTEYDVIVEDAPAGQYYEYPKSLGPGESATFWFVGQDMSGNLSCDDGACVRPSVVMICFGDSEITYNPQPAVEVQIYYDETGGTGSTYPDSVTQDDFSNIKVKTLAYDPVALRTSNNNFSPASSNCNIVGLEDKYKHRTANINPSVSPCAANHNCILAVKVKSLYTTQYIPVALGAVGNQPNLPAQGVVINSTGTSGESSRRLRVEYNLSAIPSIFDNTLFSAAGITK